MGCRCSKNIRKTRAKESEDSSVRTRSSSEDAGIEVSTELIAKAWLKLARSNISANTTVLMCREDMSSTPMFGMGTPGFGLDIIHPM